MENNENLKKSIKSKIAISNFKEEYSATNNNFIYKKIAVVACAFILLTSSIVFASKNLIRYNHESGKPVIVAGEEIPEELKGKEVVIAVPEKSSKPDYITPLKNILSKYYNSDEVEKICKEAQEKGWGNEDKLTANGGKKLYYLIYDILQMGTVTSEDRESILEYLQNLDNSAINLDEIEAEILLTLFPAPEEDSYWILHRDLEKEALILQMETNQTFVDILYKYYDKDELDDLFEKINLEHNSISDMYGTTENSEKLVEYMILLLKSENVTRDEKIILEYQARLTIRMWRLDDDLEKQLNNL